MLLPACLLLLLLWHAPCHGHMDLDEMGRSLDFMEEEGDMVLSKEQRALMSGSTKMAGRALKGNIIEPWPNAIFPYFIVKRDFNATEIDWLYKAMKDWEAVTCVKFQEYPENHRFGSTEHRVKIMRGNGCRANLGQINEYPQHVWLSNGYGGCFWVGTIQHELGHALGLPHEHQRENRDAYVRVDYYNVKSSMHSAVQKYAKGIYSKFGLPYDYKSIMHYGHTAFSDGDYVPTIWPRDPTVTHSLGYTLKPSYLDAKLVSHMHQCADKCRGTCGANCFMGPNCKCICENDDHFKEVCRDDAGWESYCRSEVAAGNCISNRGRMFTHCRKSCGVCKPPGQGTPLIPCADRSSARDCPQRKAEGKCDDRAWRDVDSCRKTCGFCVGNNPSSCRDTDNNCAQRARNGDCDRHVADMLKNCRKSCDFCKSGLGNEPRYGEQKCSKKDEDKGLCQYNKDVAKHFQTFYLMSQECPNTFDLCNVRVSASCKNKQGYDDKCLDWAKRGECQNNPGYMKSSCSKWCDACSEIENIKPKLGDGKNCVNFYIKCDSWEKRGECSNNAKWMAKNCAKSCKKCRSDGSDSSRPAATTRRPATQAPACEDDNQGCPGWSRGDGCERGKGYMHLHCKKSCGLC